jgi:phosphoglycolate phosphatase
MSIMFAEDAAESSTPMDAGGYGSEVSLKLTVFCDLDGPLIDVSRRYYKTYQLAIAETQAHFQARGRSLLLTPLSEAQFWQMKQERMPDADIAFFSGLRHDEIELFLANVLEIVNQPILLQEDQLQPGVRQSLAQLRQHSVQLSLVTLRCQIEAQQLLQELDLAHHFDYICGAEDRFSAYQNYAEGKQAILEELIRNAKDDSSAFWVIGDTEADILAGQALGLSTVALTCGIRSHAYLQRLEPTKVLPDLPTAVRYLLASVK